jgi:hypothetical protein
MYRSLILLRLPRFDRGDRERNATPSSAGETEADVACVVFHAFRLEIDLRVRLLASRGKTRPLWRWQAGVGGNEHNKHCSVGLIS